MHVLRINWLIKVGIAATIIAAQGADFVGGYKTEIRLQALSASAEVVTGNFGLHSVAAEGDFFHLWPSSTSAEAEIITFGQCLSSVNIFFCLQ